MDHFTTILFIDGSQRFALTTITFLTHWLRQTVLTLKSKFCSEKSLSKGGRLHPTQFRSPPDSWSN